MVLGIGKILLLQALHPRSIHPHDEIQGVVRRYDGEGVIVAVKARISIVSNILEIVIVVIA